LDIILLAANEFSYENSLSFLYFLDEYYINFLLTVCLRPGLPYSNWNTMFLSGMYQITS